MDRTRKVLEITANCAIILVAGVLIVTLVGNYLVKTSNRMIKPGKKITFLANSPVRSTTLLLALSESCHFCTESAPFYQKLLKETASHTDIHVVAVLPQPSAAGRGYLQRIGVTIDDVKSLPLNSIPVSGTPTLILTNGSGIVTDVWVGRLTPDTENEVISKVKCGQSKCSWEDT